ncbi:hypothetical protein KOR42_34030 [Thalassoglobus neptunius]|uniref:Replication-relaxation n=1 Tax=Thalassoglobus neptunius TaxID=1938619 RepID=A0A5C5WLQ0_9PLAN|nr:replication-relaxation family protein [Thalassoglobus neptunius]TWT51716.1 hypothetical protein KOR42_34030 [Thalassoglobus neptunius]
MPKRNRANIGPRDIELLMALDRCPLTVGQLCRLSLSFAAPFNDESNLRRRLRALANAGLLKSWRYSIASEGQSPKYFKLSRDGYRMLYGFDAVLPRRRYFEEIRPGHHHHTFCLAELVVRLITTGQREGTRVRHFARENSVKLVANGFTLFPDCAFQLVTRDGQEFNFVVELDNGTERIRTAKDVESIERKLRGYDAHQSQFASSDRQRYLVLFVTTRSSERTKRILDLAALVMQNPQRTVFLACDLPTLDQHDPFEKPVFVDHRGLKRTLLPITSRRPPQPVDSRGEEIKCEAISLRG